MRQDLNKLLCERERRGSRMKFRNQRHKKDFKAFDRDGEEIRTREGMKDRYYGGTKDFSENLRPLKGIIRKAVGRKWEDFYSDLRRNFRMDTQINLHILQHLYDYIATETYIKNDEVYCNPYRTMFGEEKVAGSRFEFYVDPRTRIIRRNKNVYKRYKFVKQEDSNYKKINSGLALGKIDGIWYLFDLVPAKSPSDEDGYLKTVIRIGFYGHTYKEKHTAKHIDPGSWKTEKYRDEFGVIQSRDVKVRDVFLNKNPRTAGKKWLREFNLTNDVKEQTISGRKFKALTAA